VQIKHEVRARQKLAHDIMGDHLSRRTVGIARKGPIKVALAGEVEGRGPPSDAGRRGIGGRDDDDTPADPVGFKLAGQLHQGHLAFVLVAVIAGNQKDLRPRAVGDAHDRYRQPSVCRTVDRVGQAQKSGLLAVPLEVDFRADPRCLRVQGNPSFVLTEVEAAQHFRPLARRRQEERHIRIRGHKAKAHFDQCRLLFGLSGTADTEKLTVLLTRLGDFFA